jgi:hypothetical protein
LLHAYVALEHTPQAGLESPASTLKRAPRLRIGS